MSTSAEHYSTASSRFTALLADIPADSWDAPSRCEGWSIREVVDHVVSTEAGFLREHGLAIDDTEGLAPQASWPVVRGCMQAALADPAAAELAFDGYFGPTTVHATVDRFYTLDLIVHRWDIASACGLSAHAGLDAGEVATIRANLAGLDETVLRTPGLFGAEVPVPADADEQTKALAFIGRAAT